MDQQTPPSEEKIASKTAEFMQQLYLILVGLGYGFSIESLVSEKITYPSVVRFIIVVFMLTTWLHGQLAYGLSETYEVKGRWLTRVIENYIEIAAVILVMITALVQTQEVPLYSVVLATYAFDLLLEIAYVLRLRSARRRYVREYETARSWIWMDLVAVVALAAILIARLNMHGFSEPFAATGIAATVIAVAIWDYSRNRDFYFGIPLGR